MSKIQQNKGYFYEKDGVKVSLVNSPEVTRAIKKRRIIKKTVGWSILAAILIVFAINILILPFTSSFPRVERITTYAGDNPYICFYDRTQISAHRAGGDLAPEETMMAFELCMTVNSYVDIVEFDLHLTKDNQLVLLHDDTLDRTSNAVQHFGHKKVYASDKTYAELRELNMGENFKDPQGNYPYRGKRGDEIPDNAKILKLDDLLSYLESARPDGDLDYIIEIKDGGSRGERAMDILYQKMVEYNITDRTVVGTFQGNVTRYIDKHYGDLNRSASIAEVLDFFYAFLYNVNLNNKNLKYNVLQIPYELAILNLGTQAVVDYAHKYDLAVQYWTVNDKDKIRELVEYGADAIMTDNPEKAYDVIYGG